MIFIPIVKLSISLRLKPLKLSSSQDLVVGLVLEIEILEMTQFSLDRIGDQITNDL